MRKNHIYSLFKTKYCCCLLKLRCIIRLTFWKLVEKTVEKKVGFSNQILCVSKMKKLSLFK